MYCTNCGKENPSGNRFCTGCGCELKQPEQPAQESDSYRQTSNSAVTSATQVITQSFQVKESVGTFRENIKVMTVNKLIAAAAAFMLILSMFVPFLSYSFFVTGNYSMVGYLTDASNAAAAVVYALYSLLWIALYFFWQICGRSRLSVIGCVGAWTTVIFWVAALSDLGDYRDIFSYAWGYYMYIIALIIMTVTVFLKPITLGGTNISINVNNTPAQSCATPPNVQADSTQTYAAAESGVPNKDSAQADGDFSSPANNE